MNEKLGISEMSGENFNFDRICRICWKTRLNMISLFAKIENRTPFEKLVSNTQLTLDLEDEGPRLICGQCLEELDILVNFLDKCNKSNELLSHFNTYNTKSLSVNSSESIHRNFSKSEELSDREEDVTYPDKKQYDSCKDSIKQLPVRLSCQYCSKTFTRKFNLTTHIKCHRGEIVKCQKVNSRHTCTTCNKSFTSATNLATHLRTHTGERPFVCSECGNTFRSKNTLNDHLKIHTGEKRYMCPQCGKRFTTNKLAAHSRWHARVTGAGRRRAGERAGVGAGRRAGERPHVCALCPARYFHKQSLNKHLRQRHAD